MGTSLVCCSSASDCGSPGQTCSLDLASPQLVHDFVRQVPVSLDPADKQEVSRVRDIVRSSTCNVRSMLLAAARQDDGPGVLEQIADGASAADMSEALRIASQRGCAAVVRELVAVGLSVNCPCPHTQFSPLQLSAAGGHLAVSELLLDALADLQIVSRAEHTSAFSLAHQMGHADVEDLLDRHSARAEGTNGEETAVSRRMHVLPRVSCEQSEAMLLALASGPGVGQAQGALALASQEPKRAQNYLDEDDCPTDELPAS
mmetsp:Transcript_65237/g.172911  ORF Transcript_65237/g.172911 Transcript_65237/m.172911 type:complete len:260 (-) Transcript_65237:464-1243(-)